MLTLHCETPAEVCEAIGHDVPGDPRHPAWTPVCRRCGHNLESEDDDTETLGAPWTWGRCPNCGAKEHRGKCEEDR